MLTDKFHNVLYINLLEDTNRRKVLEWELNHFGIKAIRVNAIKGNPDKIPFPEYKEVGNIQKDADIGCVASHIKCLKIAKLAGWKNVVIFEDDAEFKEDFNVFFDQYYSEIDFKWDMLYLGGNHMGGDIGNPISPLTQLTEHISQTEYTLATHAIIVKESIYDFMIKELGSYLRTTDRSYTQAQKKFKVIVFRPNLVYQRSGYSSIEKRIVNYQFMKD